MMSKTAYFKTRLFEHIFTQLKDKEITYETVKPLLYGYVIMDDDIYRLIEQLKKRRDNT